MSESNPVVFFEIPVIDIDRAIKFYTAVFGFEFIRENIDGNDMALFPFTEKTSGISGALAKGDSYEPSVKGTRIYFNTHDIENTMLRAEENGGRLLYRVTSIGESAYVAEFEDSEGNRIALHSREK